MGNRDTPLIHAYYNTQLKLHSRGHELGHFSAFLWEVVRREACERPECYTTADNRRLIIIGVDSLWVIIFNAVRVKEETQAKRHKCVSALLNHFQTF